MIVADTNLVLHFLVEGEKSTSADQVFARDSEWHMPVLWRSEFTNALATLVRARRVSASTATEALRRGLTTFGTREHAVDAERAMQLAISSGCTAYDCEFICVAEQLAALVITYDKAVLRAFPKLAMSPDDFLA